MHIRESGTMDRGATAPMKALTIRQPWASLIALGIKQVETRSWDTAYRGPLAIHASKSIPLRIGRHATYGQYDLERDHAGLLLRGPDLAWPYRLPTGAVVAVVNLFQTCPTSSPEHRPSDLERSLGWHGPGWFAWSLSSVSPLVSPITALGSRCLWNWTPPAGIAEQLDYPGVLITDAE